MSVDVIYFSPTGGSKKSALAIAQEISDQVIEHDFTLSENISSLSFSAQDIVVFSAPVYSGRIYKGAMERFSKVKGSDTKCILVAVYGNCRYHDALVELYDAAVSQGFKPVAAAALVCEHTFGEIQAGRPDADDVSEDKAFGTRVAQLLKSEKDISLQVPGNRPYKDGGKGGKFRPSTSDKCIKCGLCVRNCPEQAISSDCKTIDDTRCISCFRCIKSCPVHAKACDTEKYMSFVADLSNKYSVRKENEYFGA